MFSDHYYFASAAPSTRDARLLDKLSAINWAFIFVLALIAGLGFAMLYSVADGSLSPWASRQIIRFAVGIVLLVTVAVIDLRVWLKLAYPAYALALLLLITVELMGKVGMGAQRWLEIGSLQLQPSEIMKIALVLALARYFHALPKEDLSRFVWLLPPVALVLVPCALIIRQPDLGTATLIGLSGFSLFFLAGVGWGYFIAAAVLVAGAVPLAWTMLLHDYQRERVLTFLEPSRDPLGAGYHAIQAKIALGAGGLTGRGYMQGTQSHLDFLPEKHTDFIFTMFGEEFGLFGGLVLLTLYGVVLVSCLSVALQCRNHFGRLVAGGVTVIFFLYIFINIAMVMGLVPVVGVPLPLVSYGGTAMMSLMFGFGLMMSVYVHRGMELPRSSPALW
jgi:rod shape determining protein RodA